MVHLITPPRAQGARTAGPFAATPAHGSILRVDNPLRNAAALARACLCLWAVAAAAAVAVAGETAAPSPWAGYAIVDYPAVPGAPAVDSPEQISPAAAANVPAGTPAVASAPAEAFSTARAWNQVIPLPDGTLLGSGPQSPIATRDFSAMPAPAAPTFAPASASATTAKAATPATARTASPPTSSASHPSAYPSTPSSAGASGAVAFHAPAAYDASRAPQRLNRGGVSSFRPETSDSSSLFTHDLPDRPRADAALAHDDAKIASGQSTDSAPAAGALRARSAFGNKYDDAPLMGGQAARVRAERETAAPSATSANIMDAENADPKTPAVGESAAAARDGASAPRKKSAARPGGGRYGAAVLYILVCAAGAWFLARMYKKYGAKNPGARGGCAAMEVLGRTYLDPRHYFVLLRVGGKVLVVGVGGGRMEALGEISDPAELAALLEQARPKSEAGRSFFAALFQKQFMRTSDEARSLGFSGQPETVAFGLSGAHAATRPARPGAHAETGEGGRP